MVVTTSDKVYVHFGRGGAGNITNPSPHSSRRPGSIDPQSTKREVSGRRFSTGIGGIGNISSANKLEQQTEAEEIAGLLHDIQAPGIVLVERDQHTGRGGAANTYRPNDTEMSEARMNNEHMRRQSLATLHQRRESLATSIPLSRGSSRRTSMAESMKEFIMGRRMSKS